MPGETGKLILPGYPYTGYSLAKIYARKTIPKVISSITYGVSTTLVTHMCFNR